MIDPETRECLETQISRLEERIEKSMSEKFSHLEQLMRQTAGTNDKEHERMSRQIGELYEENKRDRETADGKIERVTAELDAKIDKNGERITNLEQRQSADEGVGKGKQLTQGQMVAVVGILFGVISGGFQLLIFLLGA